LTSNTNLNLNQFLNLTEMQINFSSRLKRKIVSWLFKSVMFKLTTSHQHQHQQSRIGSAERCTFYLSRLLKDIVTGWQPCCRSCSWIHSNNDELAAGSWCCTESEMVSSPYPQQLPWTSSHLHQKVRNEICAVQYRRIQRTLFSSAIRLWNTLPVNVCQLPSDSFKTHLNTFLSSKHQTMSYFYRLHCTVFIRSYCLLFAARLSPYTSAYSFVVRNCSKSSRHRYRKLHRKMSYQDNTSWV